MKIFSECGIEEQSAYFGWQDESTAIYGLIMGYKESADDLVKIALERKDIKTLDTYIFPILFSYRHSIELYLKHIYFRFSDKVLKGHNLIILWDRIKSDIIENFLENQEMLERVSFHTGKYVKYSIDELDLKKIRELLNELQGANQKKEERVNVNKVETDQNAEVWRYLLDRDSNLFFNKNHFVDYTILKEGIDYLHKLLEYIYFIVDSSLSS